MGGNQSSAGMATAGSALGIILAFFIEKGIGGDLTDVVEGAIVTFTTFAFCYLMPSGAAALTDSAKKLSLFAVTLVLGLSLTGCTSLGIGGGTKPETPAQRIYAAQGDWNRVASAVRIYVTSPTAIPSVVEVLQDAEGRGYKAITKANEVARLPISPNRDRDLQLYVNVLEAAIGELTTHLLSQGVDIKAVKMGGSAGAIALILLQILGLIRAGVTWSQEDKVRASRLEDKLKQMVDEKRDPTLEELADIQAETDQLHEDIQNAGKPAADDPGAAT